MKKSIRRERKEAFKKAYAEEMKKQGLLDAKVEKNATKEKEEATVQVTKKKTAKKKEEK